MGKEVRKALRLDQGLADRIDAARGLVSWSAWVTAELERVLPAPEVPPADAPLAQVDPVLRDSFVTPVSVREFVAASGVKSGQAATVPLKAASSGCPECGSLGRVHQKGCKRSR